METPPTHPSHSCCCPIPFLFLNRLPPFSWYRRYSSVSRADKYRQAAFVECFPLSFVKSTAYLPCVFKHYVHHLSQILLL
jgi:hypothetical protein